MQDKLFSSRLKLNVMKSDVADFKKGQLRGKPELVDVSCKSCVK